MNSLLSNFDLNISTWADGIVARVNQHSTLTTLGEYSSVPVINSLCDLYHPCQALADFLTLQEVQLQHVTQLQCLIQVLLLHLKLIQTGTTVILVITVN